VERLYGHTLSYIARRLWASRRGSLYGLWRRHINPPMAAHVRSMWRQSRQAWNGPDSTEVYSIGIDHKGPTVNRYSRHVRAISWPSGRWRARRRIDTGYTGRLHGRKHGRGHVQPRFHIGGGVGQRKGCRRRRRSSGGPPAWCNAYGRGRHPAAQRTCARPTRRTGGRMGSTTARPGASNRTGKWRHQPPTRRRHRSRRACTIICGSS